MDLVNSDSGFGDDLHDDSNDSLPTPRPREGLPPSFKMRADKHYVEQLDRPSTDLLIRVLPIASIDIGARRIEAIPALTQSVKRHGVLQPLLVTQENGITRLIDGGRRLQAAIDAGLRDVPCLLRKAEDLDDAVLSQEANMLRSHTEAAPPAVARPGLLDVADEGVRVIRSIEAASQLLSTPGLPHRMAIDLIRAQTWRAVTLLEAAAVLQHGVTGAYATSSARRVIATVANRAEHECRLAGLGLHVEHEIPESLVVAGEQDVLHTALSGLVLASTALAEGRPRVKLALTACVDPNREVTLSVSTSGVPPPPLWESRAFDATWTDRPGGNAVLVWLQAARAIIEGYGGRVKGVASAQGATLRVTMPVAAA